MKYKNFFSALVLFSLAAAPLHAGGEPDSGSQLSEFIKNFRENGLPQGVKDAAVFCCVAKMGVNFISWGYHKAKGIDGTHATRLANLETVTQAQKKTITNVEGMVGDVFLGTTLYKELQGLKQGDTQSAELQARLAFMKTLAEGGGTLALLQAFAPDGKLPDGTKFVTQVALTAKLGDYTKTTGIPALINLGDYAKTADLKGLAKTTDLPDFTTFALKADVTALQKAVGTWGSTEQTMAQAIAALQTPKT